MRLAERLTYTADVASYTEGLSDILEFPLFLLECADGECAFHCQHHSRDL